MWLERISVTNLRNIASAKLVAEAGLNVIYGPNGSGKTALLEAVYLLSSGRSFRATRVGQLVRKGQTSSVVFGVVRGQQGREHRLGVEKGIDGRTQVSINGQRMRAGSQLAERVAVQAVTPESVELIDGAPEVRRGFVDWGVFHVEHAFHETWLRYERGLRQRNGSLRQHDARGARAWETELAEAGERLGAWRAAYVEALAGEAKRYLAALDVPLEIEIRYRRGWDAEVPLAVALDRGRETDLKQGFTGIGAHRGELVIKALGDRASKVLSRGQKKLTVLALVLAQFARAREAKGEAPILLADDIAAELDAANRGFVFSELLALGAQVFVTSADEAATAHLPAPAAMFHVEQGIFRRVV